MAKQDNGIVGGFRGSVGPVTGYLWRGLWCVRSKPQQVRNPRTERQQSHRAAFRERVRLASRFGRVAYMGFHKLAARAGMTEQNWFIKCNKAAFLEGEDGLQVDWKRLIVSDGVVAPVGFGQAHLDSQQWVVSVDFEKNPMRGRTNSDDEVVLFAYCSDAEYGVLSQGTPRRAGHISLCLPDEWADHEVHLYGFVRDYTGRCSVSAYVDIATTDDEEDDSIVATESRSPQPQVNTQAGHAQSVERQCATADVSRGAVFR